MIYFSWKIVTTSALLIACVAMSYVLWQEIKSSSETEPTSVISTVSSELPIVVQTGKKNQLLSIDHYRQIIERPLFSKTRHPEKIEDVATQRTSLNKKTKQNKKIPEFTLTAVVLTPDREIALIHDPQVNKVLHLQEGDEISDWLVVSIEPREVLLSKGDEEKRLELKVRASPKASQDLAGIKSKLGKSFAEAMAKRRNLVKKKQSSQSGSEELGNTDQNPFTRGLNKDSTESGQPVDNPFLGRGSTSTRDSQANPFLGRGSTSTRDSQENPFLGRGSFTEGQTNEDPFQ